MLRRYQVGGKEPDPPIAVGQSGELYRDLHPSADDRFLAYLTSSTAGSTLSVIDFASHTSRVIGHFPVSAYLRGWTADGTAVVIVQPATFYEDTTADVVVRVVPLGKAAIREARIGRAFIATTRFDPARGLVYMTRSDAGVQNVYAYGLATSNLKQVTDNVQSDVAFSSVEVLGDGRILGVMAEHKSDIWIAERDR